MLRSDSSGQAILSRGDRLAGATFLFALGLAIGSLEAFGSEPGDLDRSPLTQSLKTEPVEQPDIEASKGFTAASEQPPKTRPSQFNGLIPGLTSSDEVLER